MKKRNKLYQIIKYFGLSSQKRKFMEEATELFEAITEYQVMCRRLEGYPADYVDDVLEVYRMHIVEELGDNLIMLGQFKELFGIKDEVLERMMRFKVKRTFERYNINE